MKTIKELMTDECNEARKAAGYKFAVCVEDETGQWMETSAVSEEMAKKLAQFAVDYAKARGASCWCVDENGRLGGRSFFNYFEQLNWDYDNEIAVD